MVLSVPPLEELGQSVTDNVTQALAGWQGVLWGAAQRLRDSPEHVPVDPRWMGTVDQLLSVIGGSVLLGGDGVDPDVIPLSTEATPAVKGTSAVPIVRLEGAPVMSGRYATLSRVIGSSVGIWPAVITVGDRGGKDAHGLRARDDSPVVLQVVARSNSRLAFRVVDKATKEVISESESAEEAARAIGFGPKPMPWSDFLEGCLWGRPASTPEPEEKPRPVVNTPGVRALASLWGLQQLSQDQVPLLALVAFLAAAAGLPEARALANEVAQSWDELTGTDKPLFDGHQLLKAVDQLAKAVLPAAKNAAAISAAQSAQALDAVSAAVYLGEILHGSLSASAAKATATTAFNALDSPRARRSMSAPASVSTYLTTVAPVQSPLGATKQKRVAARNEVDSDGDEILSPNSTRKELKRLRRLTAHSTSGEDAGHIVSVAAMRRGHGRAEASARMPQDLTDLSEEVMPAVSTSRSSGVRAASATASSSAATPVGIAAPLAAAGPTLGDCVHMAHTVDVQRLVPADADGAQMKGFGALLARGGMTDAPAAFAQAATATPTGIVPSPGTELEAEMLVEHISAVIYDLTQAKAFPMDHPAFQGGRRPADWNQAAARGRALITATARAFRTARHTQAAGQASGGAESATAPKHDKVPADAYGKVSEASTTSLKVLAVSAGVIHSLTTDTALRAERLRGSPFENLTSHTRTELDEALPGELEYFVGMYGQAATAYLVSNSRTLEEVSGRGVPAALVGVRRHLWSRALRWVTDAYGERRANQRRTDVEKLALSLLAGAVPAEPVGTEGEKLIVELLGGSKPHRSAEVEREGGSLSTGTVGKLVGEAAQHYVRAAYRKWAKGLARCMGEVLLAAAGQGTDKDTVLGREGDFGLEEALSNVPDDLPAERLRSIGRYLLEEIHVACRLHRCEPAAALPDVMEIVEQMGGDVFRYRRQEHQLETLAEAAASKVAESITERLKAVEAKHQAPAAAGKAESYKKTAKPAAANHKTGSGDKQQSDGKSATPKSEGKRPGKPARAAGVELDDGAITTTAKKAARLLEESMTGASDAGALDTRFKAIAALQAEFRKSVGAPPTRRLEEKEPCAWKALAGKCKDKSCKPCLSGLSFDASSVQAVRARCVAGLFDEAKRAAKEPG